MLSGSIRMNRLGYCFLWNENVEKDDYPIKQIVIFKLCFLRGDYKLHRSAAENHWFSFRGDWGTSLNKHSIRNS